jgi:SPOR domain
MTVQLSQSGRLLGLLAGFALLQSVGSTPGIVDQAVAQTVAPAPAKKAAAKAKPKPAEPDAEPAGSEASRDSNAAWRDYDAGVQLLQSAQPEAAAGKFSKVLAGSNIPAPLMAKTLLQRGTAYRQEGKPAQAVADLTSALYLRNGLSDPERADATAQRSAAYREAGLSEQGVATPDQSRGPAPAATASSAGSAIRMAAPSVSVPTAGLAPGAEAPAQPKSGGFFSKIFGSGDEAAVAPAQPAPAMPQSALSAWSGSEAVIPAAGAKAAAKTGTKVAAASATTEVLPWERPAGAPTAADEKSIPRKPAAVVVPKAAGAAAVANPGNPAGRFRLQLAAVMSRDEAQASAARVKSQFGADIGSRAATIDEAALGTSTMYIVRFGPYASAAEIKALCTRIRATGTDCLQAP